MVYISSWQQYQEAAENLYANSPRKTRYSIKWRSSKGQLVLKITDDVTCLKFKTNSSIFLGRFEALNRSLIQKMMNSRLPSSAAVAAPTASATLSAPHAQAAAVSPVLQGSNLPSTSNASTGGVKKKKGKKK